MEDLIESKLNKLLLLVREKKKTFFVVISLAVLLAGTIIKVEYYHRDFLIRELVINQYFNNIMSSNFSYAYSLLCEAWKEKDDEKFFEALGEICRLTILLPFFPLHTFVARFAMGIEEHKVPLWEKHRIYLVGSYAPIPYGIHTLVINTYNLKRYWLYSSMGILSYLPIQKAIKNFNEIITTERISINSYEDCVELVKTFFKLIEDFYYEDLILKEEDEFTMEVSSLESTGKVYKKYRVKSLFIFESDNEDCYYIELHIGNPDERPVLLKKCTFKIKKNGVVYDFNAIDFWIPQYFR